MIHCSKNFKVEAILAQFSLSTSVDLQLLSEQLADPFNILSSTSPHLMTKIINPDITFHISPSGKCLGFFKKNNAQILRICAIKLIKQIKGILCDNKIKLNNFHIACYAASGELGFLPDFNKATEDNILQKCQKNNYWEFYSSQKNRIIFDSFGFYWLNGESLLDIQKAIGEAEELLYIYKDKSIKNSPKVEETKYEEESEQEEESEENCGENQQRQYIQIANFREMSSKAFSFQLKNDINLQTLVQKLPNCFWCQSYFKVRIKNQNPKFSLIIYSTGNCIIYLNVQRNYETKEYVNFLLKQIKQALSIENIQLSNFRASKRYFSGSLNFEVDFFKAIKKNVFHKFIDKPRWVFYSTTGNKIMFYSGGRFVLIDKSLKNALTSIREAVKFLTEFKVLNNPEKQIKMEVYQRSQNHPELSHEKVNMKAIKKQEEQEIMSRIAEQYDQETIENFQGSKIKQESSSNSDQS